MNVLLQKNFREKFLEDEDLIIRSTQLPKMYQRIILEHVMRSLIYISEINTKTEATEVAQKTLSESKTMLERYDFTARCERCRVLADESHILPNGEYICGDCYRKEEVK